MGEQVLTLADLVPADPLAVVVGINPAPVSVEAGHYYQGRLGQTLFARLRRIGVLPADGDAWGDDLAHRCGFGFTDIVKRPTCRAELVTSAELDHGRPRLLERLEHARPRVVVFTFKKTAAKLLGGFDGCGLRPGVELAGAPVFVMPGPYAPRETVERELSVLRELLGSRASRT